MLELTVPTNTPTGLSQARTRKPNKPEYSNLVTDFESLGWKVNYNTVEIGSLGHFTQDTVEAVTDTLLYEHIDDAFSIVVRRATTAIACSNQIFLAHKQIMWDSERNLLGQSNVCRHGVSRGRGSRGRGATASRASAANSL